MMLFKLFHIYGNGVPAEERPPLDIFPLWCILPDWDALTDPGHFAGCQGCKAEEKPPCLEKAYVLFGEPSTLAHNHYRITWGGEGNVGQLGERSQGRIPGRDGP